MANRTNKQNRTFLRTCSVCSSSAPHRTEPNNTLVRFVFSRYPCSVLFDSNSNRTVPLFGSCSASSNYSKQWPRNNGRKNNDVTGVHKYSEIGIIKNSVVFA